MDEMECYHNTKISFWAHTCAKETVLVGQEICVLLDMCRWDMPITVVVENIIALKFPGLVLFLLLLWVWLLCGFLMQKNLVKYH